MTAPLPSYAEFDDYRFNMRVAVNVRWSLIVAYLLLHNYRPTFDVNYVSLNVVVIALSALNGFAHWRVLRNRPITWQMVLALSVMDLVLITGGIAITSRFGNQFFVLYYPALLALSVVFPSRRVSFTGVTLVALAYAAMSIWMEPGLDLDAQDEKHLAIRIITMYAVVGAAVLIAKIERERRREAVDAERVQAAENLELQKKAQEAERAAELQEANELLQAELDQRRLAEEALERRGSELAAVNRELEAFSYSVSHDLRAPLRTVDGFTEALLEEHHDALDEQGKDYLNRVRGASRRMGELITDLLGLSTVTRQQMTRETVDLSGIANEVAEEFQRTDPDRETQFSIADGLVSKGDRRLLTVVMENLIGNAWKYTAQQTEPKIEVGVVDNGEAPRYFVRDNGVGFDMDYADRLFGAFQRLHADEEFEGTGIGLATVQRIIVRHGGEVWAEGSVGKGATFYFTLS